MIAAKWKVPAAKVVLPVRLCPRWGITSCFSYSWNYASPTQEVRSTLEAYLDRRTPGWRDLRSGHSDREEPRQSRGRHGGMTTTEAYEVLGLKAGAKEAEIRAAHRRLMMKFHPDQGGSTNLAARINEAKRNPLRAQVALP